MTVPSLVAIGPLTPPTGRLNATLSTSGLVPTSGSGAPREMSCVSFASSPSVLAAAAKSRAAPSVAAISPPRVRLSSPAFGRG